MTVKKWLMFGIGDFISESRILCRSACGISHFVHISNILKTVAFKAIVHWKTNKRKVWRLQITAWCKNNFRHFNWNLFSISFAKYYITLKPEIFCYTDLLSRYQGHVSDGSWIQHTEQMWRLLPPTVIPANR